MKELSIIIPSYQKPKSLRRLLNSIKKCTNRKLTDIIVVLDDGTEPRELKLEYPEMIIIKSGGNKTGFTNPVWKGVLISNSHIVGVLGDDTEFVTSNADELIIEALKCGDGIQYDYVFGLNDGIQNGRAHPFMLKHYWLSGLGYPPCYIHYFGDSELYKIARHHNKWIHIKECVIKHHHEYSAKLGHQGINVIENGINDSREVSKNDGATHKRRMEWWEKNGKPRAIPWNII